MHLDNNKLNCHVSNLKWGTYSENNAQAIRDGLNTVPIPDTRKHYSVYNEITGDKRFFFGVKSLISECELNYSDSGIRNIINRNKKLKYGPYEGYNIKRADLIKPFTCSFKPFVLLR